MTQISNTMMLCLILGLIGWYYFTRLQDSEKEYNKLHKRFEQVCVENQKAKSRLKDLENYRDDVSKTFRILDNELLLINEHLQKNETSRVQQRRRPFQTLFQSTVPLASTSVPSMSNVAHVPVSVSNVALPNSNIQIPLTSSVSLLTPELLNTLFNNMNSETVQPQSDQYSNTGEIPDAITTIPDESESVPVTDTDISTKISDEQNTGFNSSENVMSDTSPILDEPNMGSNAMDNVIIDESVPISEGGVSLEYTGHPDGYEYTDHNDYNNLQNIPDSYSKFLIEK